MGSSTRAGLALQHTFEKPESSGESPGGAQGRGSPQPPLLACVRQQPSVGGFGGHQACKWAAVAPQPWLCYPGEVAQVCLSVPGCAVCVHAGRGAEGTACLAAGSGLCSVSRSLPHPCPAGLGGAPCPRGEQPGGQDNAFAPVPVPVCVSVGCSGVLWSVLGCSRTARAVCDDEAGQALWASLAFLGKQIPVKSHN